jgi:hypothetical protein
MERTFDRIVSFDEQSKQFPIKTLIGSKLRRSYTWRCDTFLDQGQEGACTGFGTAHEAAARPVVIKNITNDIAMQIYKRARQLDEWPGENYEGSSVLGAVKAAVEKKWYAEYRWAFGEEDLALTVGYYGPVILGINWYTGMCQTDSSGMIHPTGRIEGGHCVLCNGYSKTKRLYRIHNSWGKDNYGINGEAFISEEDMSRLLDEQGECCIPVKRLKG